MKGKQKRKGKGEEERPPEPRWKQQKPAARRRKARSNEAVAPKVAAAAALLGLPAKGHARAVRTGGDGGGRGSAVKPGLRLRAIRITWRRLALLPLLALLALGGWELGNNDRFYVMQPEIVGNVRVPAEEIVAASEIHGTHILWIRGSAVADRVRKVDGIADAAVKVRLPNQVIIEVRERTPLLVWKVGGQELWVSQDGAPIPAVGTAPELTLTDANAAAAAPAAEERTGNSGTGKGAAGAVTATLKLRPQVVADILALESSRPEVKTLYYGRQEGLYFVAPEGWAVYLGDDGDVTRKLVTLQAVRERAANEGAPLKVVDLRLEGQAFYK